MTQRLPAAPTSEQLPDRRPADAEDDGDDLILPEGSLVVRIYTHAGRQPKPWYGFRNTPIRKPGRFDAFDAPGVDGVCYLAIPDFDKKRARSAAGDASAVATCLAETAQDKRVLDRLDERSLVIAQLTRPLTLLDVSSDWGTRARAGTHLSTAPKQLTSQWGVSIAQRWPDLHGITWISSVRPSGRALVLWSPRAQAELTTAEPQLHRALDDPYIRPVLTWAAHLTGTVLVP